MPSLHSKSTPRATKWKHFEPRKRFNPSSDFIFTSSGSQKRITVFSRPMSLSQQEGYGRPSLQEPSHSRDGSPVVTSEIINRYLELVFSSVSLYAMISLISRDPEHAGSYVTYGVSLFLRHVVGLLHHSIDSTGPVSKEFWRRMDRISHLIYVAGLFTPFCTVSVPSQESLALLLVVYLLLVIASTLSAIFQGFPPWASATFLLSIGLFAILMVREVITHWGNRAAADLVSGVVLMFGGGVVEQAIKFQWNRHFGHHELSHLLFGAGDVVFFVFLSRTAGHVSVV
eukprot:gnl/Dysnectes_brevis/2696_a3270_1300.p1 GENE.gnl/Dysnectes_brevis/2696_a3270_1300~~gnl/Dysnectes_brevis/2696_a3270_1300.p1  ORF type:complete len:285 (+),score=49.88 gnl/Dysnectes_brevis/2696_a3270_1300:665-1519(+)